VYIAGRSETKGNVAIAKLEQETGKTEVRFLLLDLADIPSVTAAARELVAKEQRLDLLFHNAFCFLV
jgi:retinol dehydrogenase 12